MSRQLSCRDMCKIVSWSDHYYWHRSDKNFTWFNSLAPGRFEWNFRDVMFKLISVIDGWSISSEIALRWLSLKLTDDKSALVQVMAWCRQATSHYLSQCWPRSLSPYGVTRPQWVELRPEQKTFCRQDCQIHLLKRKVWYFYCNLNFAAVCSQGFKQ